MRKPGRPKPLQHNIGDAHFRAEAAILDLQRMLAAEDPLSTRYLVLTHEIGKARGRAEALLEVLNELQTGHERQF